MFSQGVAVLGIALIAMGEEIGSEMALRTFGHLVSSSVHCQLSVILSLISFTEYFLVLSTPHHIFALFLPLILLNYRPFCLIVWTKGFFHIFTSAILTFF